MRKTIALLCLLALAACGSASREQLTAEADYRTAIINGNYQAVFRCFAPQLDGGKGHIYPDLKTAEHVYSFDGNWYGILKFSEVTPDQTRIEMWHLLTDILERDFKRALDCQQPI